jgi:hypothetical protein
MFCRQSKQLTVLDPRPAHFHDSNYVVARQVISQASRYALIKQHAHGREPGLQLAAGRPPPFHA